MSATNKVRATLIEMWNRCIPSVKDGSDFIYWNGEDNLYPEEIERVINNSPTAFRASKLMAKFIGGSGVLNEQTGQVFKYSELPFVNQKKALKITDIINMGAAGESTQGGAWFHVGWGVNSDGELYQSHIDVLDYKKPRIGKEDDEDNLGKIYVKEWSEKSRFGQKKSEVKWYYPYSPDKKVVAAQIKADAKIKGNIQDFTEAIKKYRGQIFYMNNTPQYKYALSPADSVYNDADTEYRMSLYRNMQTRSGFLGKTLVLTQGLDEEKAEEVKEDLKMWLGAENSDSLYHMDVEQTDNLANFVNIQQLKPQFDDKLFIECDKTVRRNILGAFNNIPEALVNASDGALFGTSADTYKEMKLFYSEQVEEEREKLQETLAYLGFPVIIEPIVRKETIQTPTE